MTHAALFEIQLYAMLAAGVLSVLALVIAPFAPKKLQQRVLWMTGGGAIIVIAVVAFDVLRVWSAGWRP